MYFCDAAESENFSVTARKYNVPPSGISQTVKRLEKELSVKLFNRASNRITLSDKGKILYEGAKEALSVLAATSAKLSDCSGEPTGEIRIALRTHRRTVTEAIEKFRRTYPSVSFIITHSGERDDYDFIVTSEQGGIGKYERRKVLKERMLLALGEGAEYLGEELSQYKNERFVAMGASTDFMRAMTECCSRAGFSPNVVIQTDDPFYVRKYVEMGMGITMVPEVSWRGLFSERIRLVNVGDCYRDVYVYSKRESEMSLAAKLFSGFLFETFDKES